MAEEEKKKKTPSYVLRAQGNYRRKFDQVSIRIPKGSCDIIRKATGESINGYLNRLIREDLKKNHNIDLE